MKICLTLKTFLEYIYSKCASFYLDQKTIHLYYLKMGIWANKKIHTY